MTFLNFILVFGTAAASVPIIIHLLNRQRFQVLPWGAMHLLENVIRKHTRRLKWEHLILLLVRASIPLFLALCMARPVLTGLQNLAGAARTSQVILLDNSLSMEGGSAEKPNFALARENAVKIAAELPRGSEIAVVGMAGAIAELAEPSSDPAGAVQRLKVLNGGYGLATPAASLETAAGLFGTRLHHADRSLAIISDFQKVSWGAEESTARTRAMDLLRAQPVPPRVILFRTGEEIKDNIAIENIELSKTLVGVGQKIQVRANIKNHGAKAYPDLRVFFRVDGVEKSASQVNLAPNGSAQVLFTHAFDRAGSHIVEVRTEGDSLKADNVAQASIPVLDQLPVLLISGDANPEPLKSETAFLEIALQPFATALLNGIGAPPPPKSRSGSKSKTPEPAPAPTQGLADLISSSVVIDDKFVSSDLTKVKVIVLANVKRLSDEQVKMIDEFVRNGGGLFVFPGNNVDANWYNSKLAADANSLLPCKLGALKGNPFAEASTAISPSAGIVVQHYDHPALALFNNPKNGSLRGAQIRQWFLLEPVANAAVSAAPILAAKLDTGDPLLVEKPYGEGRVMLCATACDADWGNLPMRPSFLPLVQQIVTHLASKVYPPRNVEIGQRIGAFLPPEMAGKRLMLTTPDGKKLELTAAKKEMHGLFEYNGANKPGLYLLELPDGGALHFVVRSPAIESNPVRLNDEAMFALAKQLDATVVNSWDEFYAADHQRRFGREIWPPLMWFVLGLAFVELFLLQYITRRVP